MPVLKCTDLGRAFSRTYAVRNVSCAIMPGEIYGLVGRNGAGKSTLLKLMAGLLSPTEGTVEVCGRAMAPCETSERLGFLIEQPAVYGDLSAYQNVMMRALAQGAPDPDAAATEALGRVGLAADDYRRARTCSVGWRQRLGLALAFMGAPAVVLLDEPFNGLDAEGVRLMRKTVRALAETRGTAVVISSHGLDQLERLVTRYGILHEGRLVRELTAQQVYAERLDYLTLRTPEAPRALAALEQAVPDAAFTMMPDDAIRITGQADAEQVGRILLAKGIPVSGLEVSQCDIEDYFLGQMEATPTGKPVAGAPFEAFVRKDGE